ncbi:exosome 3'-_5 exonuclease subunit ski4 (Csl4) [Taxawa tesnikishii (nom. ined.)]|nr:exosome 3'->5 exonuclease subunit ski4 (Csl4) [Dothideales sp. JES 119]
MPAIPAFALPGNPLAPTSTHSPGPGTHLQGTQLCASIAGPVRLIPAVSKKALPSLTIGSTSPAAVVNGGEVKGRSLLPKVGDVVLGRVTRINPRQATFDILAVSSGADTTTLREPFQALIRQQDIRATEIDKVKVDQSFRVGDIVRAVVISVGDERNYYASTAKNEYGVVMAWSESGKQMCPVSWREMREVLEDGALGAAEARKVAKPI